jgi:molecular chaperone GrpE
MGEATVMDAISAEAEREQQASAGSEQNSGDIADLLTILTDLKVCFDSKIRYDQVKEQQIAALHEELEAHRKGLYQQILRPVLIDLIGIYDQVAASQAADELLLEVIETVLERYGVTRYQCDGDGIDRSRQKVIDVELTDDAGLDRRLARRLRPGFEVDDKVLRPEWVVAYRLTAGSGFSG